MRKSTTELLIKMGIPAKIDGFRYICDAMEIYGRGGKIKLGDVYTEIAEKYRVKWHSVERCIRHALYIARNSGNLDPISRYYSPGMKWTNGNALMCIYLTLEATGND